MQLLYGQTQAIDGLNKLHSFQAQALKESRYYNHMYCPVCIFLISTKAFYTSNRKKKILIK
jgi:hypothetical protein